MIAGMSIGSWILLTLILLWAVVAVKIYFFGGFKKNKKKGFSVGCCCNTGDSPCSARSCAGCSGCNQLHVRKNAVLPEFEIRPK